MPLRKRHQPDAAGLPIELVGHKRTRTENRETRSKAENERMSRRQGEVIKAATKGKHHKDTEYRAPKTRNVDVLNNDGSISRRRSVRAQDEHHVPFSDWELRDYRGNLCVICRTINIVWLSSGSDRSDSPVVKGGTLLQALQNQDCALCRLVTTSVHKRCNQSPTFFDDKFLNRLTLEDMSSVFWQVFVRLRRRMESRLQSTDPTFRELIIDARKPNQPLFRRDVGHFEICGLPNDREVLIRTPPQPHFDPDIACSWLKLSSLQEPEVDDSRDETLAELAQRKKFRLLDVYSGKIVVPETVPRYLTLSYVWGSATVQNEFRISHTNSGYLKNGSYAVSEIHVKGLPKTLRDSAMLVRRLGERYLWIDVLCIDQASLDDKQEILAAMGAIYRNSYLTIVAADGSEASSGISRLSGEDIILGPPVSLQTCKSELNLLPPAQAFEDVLSETKWNTRGWTLQEHFQSRRCLFFTKTEVFYAEENLLRRETFLWNTECENEHLSQDLHLPDSANPEDVTVEGQYVSNGTANKQREQSLNRSLMHRFRATGGQFELYQDTIAAYSQRDLTKASDRLDAVKGMLHYLYPEDIDPGRRYALSGLLEQDFSACLSWQAVDFPGDRAHRVQRSTSDGRYLPTWSWAGCSYTITFVPPQSEFRLEILDTHNIQCVETSNGQDEEWPFTPSKVCQPSGGPVVLHLWKRVIKAYLRPTPLAIQMPENDRVGKYAIHFQTVDSTLSCLGFIVLDKGFVEARDQNFLYDFLVMDRPSDLSNAFLLIERHGDFAERVTYSYRAIGPRPPNFPEEVRVIEKSVAAQSEYQHIQLI